MWFFAGPVRLGIGIQWWQLLFIALLIVIFTHATYSFFRAYKKEDEDVPIKWKPVEAVTISVTIYFLAQVVAGLLISILPLVKHWSTAQATDWIEANVWATFGFVLLLESVTILLIYLFIKRRSSSFNTLGINKPQTKHILYALAGFAVYFVFYVVGLLVAKALVPSLDLEQKQEIGFSTTTKGLALIPVFLSLVILPPITEEIVARGFMFGGLRSKLPFLVAATITSILFAVAHLGAAAEGLLWVAAIDTFILSIVLCYLREKSGSLWPSIGLHAIKNSLAFIILFNIVDLVR